MEPSGRKVRYQFVDGAKYSAAIERLADLKEMHLELEKRLRIDIWNLHMEGSENSSLYQQAAEIHHRASVLANSCKRERDRIKGLLTIDILKYPDKYNLLNADGKVIDRITGPILTAALDTHSEFILMKNLRDAAGAFAEKTDKLCWAFSYRSKDVESLVNLYRTAYWSSGSETGGPSVGLTEQNQDTYALGGDTDVV